MSPSAPVPDPVQVAARAAAHVALLAQESGLSSALDRLHGVVVQLRTADSAGWSGAAQEAYAIAAGDLEGRLRHAEAALSRALSSARLAAGAMSAHG